VIRLLLAVALLMVLGAPRADAAGACQQFYDATVAVPAGWGAAYDLFHAQHAPLASVDCTVAPTPLLVGQPNDSTVYVYQTAYISASDASGAWTPVALSAAQPPSPGGWLQVPATAPLNLTSGQLNANWNYVAFLTARWNGAKWLIGCSDAVCATSNWSLQAITRQTTLTIKLSPVAPNIADDTALGTTVGVLTCSWSDASPCTAVFGITDPAGIYKLSGANLVVDPAGAGVGAAGTHDTVTLTATQ
jgi:hypothetical protein